MLKYLKNYKRNLFVTLYALLVFVSENYGQEYAEMYIGSSATLSGITGWTTITGFSNGTTSSNWSFSGSIFTADENSAGDYMISFSLSFGSSTTGLWSAGISVDGNDPDETVISRDITNNDVGNISASGFYTVTDGQTISIKANPPSASSSLDIEYAQVVLVRREDISNYDTYAEMGILSGSSSISLPKNVYTQVTGFSQGDKSTEWSFSTPVLTNSSGAGIYYVAYTASFSGTNNTNFIYGISVDDGDPAKILFERKIVGNTDIGNAACFGILNLSNSSTVEIKAATDASSTKSITPVYSNLTLVMISGGTSSTESTAHASMDITSSAVQSSIAASNSAKITGFTNDITDANFWSYSSNTLSPAGVSSGVYLAHYFMSFNTGISSSDLSFKIFKNSSEQEDLTAKRMLLSTGDYGALFGTGIIDVSVINDQFELFIANNGGADVTPTINSSRFLVTRIDKTSDTVLPVELLDFTASPYEDGVILNWTTASEINNYGFEIERQSIINESTEPGTSDWIKIGFVEGYGNSNSPKNYEYIDEQSPAGSLQYRLKQIDTDGSFTYYNTIAEVSNSVTGIKQDELPTEFSLYQNYPNPFNPTTTIKYAIPVSQEGPVNVLLKIHNVLGQEVVTLVNEEKQPGIYYAEFNAVSAGQPLASGIYYYSITTGKFKQTRKLVLAK